MANRLLEKYVQVVREDGLNTNKNVNIGVNGATPNLNVAGNLVVTGTIAGGAESVTAQTITSASANAFAVGPNGVTNPSFNVDASTASAATGLNVKSAAAAAGLAVSVLSSGTNENLTVDAKGSGTFILQGTATGAITLARATGVTGALTGTSTSATALAIGPAGATNPTLVVDASTGSAATGVKITGAAAAGGVVLSAVSSGTNENLTIQTKGSGTLNLNNGNGGGNFSVFGGNLGIDSTSSNALAVGPADVTNPTFVVDSSTASVATGIKVKGAAAAAGVAVTVVSSGTDESLTLSAKGAGTTTFNSAVVATAGGAAASGIRVGSLNVGFYTGTGTPTFSAMNGSLYVDSNATTTTTRLYVNKSGAGTAGTTWTNFTAAA